MKTPLGFISDGEMRQLRRAAFLRKFLIGVAIATAVFAAFLFYANAASAAELIGTATDGVDAGAVGYTILDKITATSTGTGVFWCAWNDASNQGTKNVKLALYSHDSGADRPMNAIATTTYSFSTVSLPRGKFARRSPQYL